MLMKRLGQRYVQYNNRTYHRSGTLWEGRFRSCLMQEDSYVPALIKRYSLYQALGGTDGGRANVYRELFRLKLDSGLVEQIRSATNENYVLGSSRLTTAVESLLGQRVTRGKSGRPKQAVEAV